MIRKQKYKNYQVPCKIRNTSKIKIFIVNALSFTHACKILLYELDNDWIIGYSSM